MNGPQHAMIDKQRQAFAALFDPGQRILFQHQLFTPPKFEVFPFLSPQRWPFFTLNPYKEEAKSRGKEHVALMQAFTIEADNISLSLQQKWFRAILGSPTVAVFSGNKSIHCHVRFTSAINAEQKTALDILLGKAFLFSDSGVFADIAKLCRVPGGSRDGNGTNQAIMLIGQRFGYEDIIDQLRHKTSHIKAVPTRARTFLKVCGDREKVPDEKLTGELHAALCDLLACGYTLAPDTFEYVGLSEQDRLLPLLAETLERAKKAPVLVVAPKREAKKAIRTGDLPGWIEETMIRNAGNWQAFYEAHGIYQVRPAKMAGKMRGFTPGAHHTKIPGFLFGIEKGDWFNFYDNTHGFPQDYIASQRNCSTGDAMRYLAQWSGVEIPRSYCKYCQQEVDWIKNRPHNLDGTRHNCKTVLVPDLPELPEAPPEANQASTIAEAWARTSPLKYIIALPGAGKTWTAENKFIEAISEKKRVAWVGSSKKDLAQFVDNIEKKTGFTFDRLGCLCLQSGCADGKSRSEHDDDVLASSDLLKFKGIATHKTYALRKGVGKCFYNFLRFAGNCDLLIIDEANEYLEALTSIVPVGARYERHKSDGGDSYRYHILHKCPSFGRKRQDCRCSNCHLSTNGIEFDVNKYNVPFVAVKNLRQSEFEQPKDDILPPNALSCHNIDAKNMLVNLLSKSKKPFTVDWLPSVKYAEGEVFNDIKGIQDLVDCSYAPMCYFQYPTLRGVRVDDPNTLTPEDREKVKYPVLTCNVGYLFLQDLAPLTYFFRNTKEIVFLCTDSVEQNLNLVKAAMPKIDVVTINHSNKRVKKVVVLGFKGNPHMITLERKTRTKTVRFDPLCQTRKLLIFEPTEEKAKYLFDLLPDNFPARRFLKNETEDKVTTPFRSKFAGGDPITYNTLITHTLGNLGKATNLPDFMTVIVDTCIYKPMVTLKLGQEMTPDAIAAAQRQQRFEKAKQNAARITREPDGIDSASVKVIIYTGLEDRATFDDLVQFCEYQKISADPVEVAFFEEDFDALIQTGNQVHETGGTLTVVPEKREADKLQGKKISDLSKKQREEAQKIDTKGQQEDAEQAVLRKIFEDYSKDIRKRDLEKRYNASKYPKRKAFIDDLFNL